MKKILFYVLLFFPFALTAIEIELYNYSQQNVNFSLYNAQGQRSINMRALASLDSMTIPNLSAGQYTFDVTFVNLYATVAGATSVESTITLDEHSNDFYIDEDFMVEEFNPEDEEE